MKKDIEKEWQTIKKISGLIRPEYLDKAEITLKENKGDKDSIVITVENNPWRNGVINGDMLLGRIKTGGKIQYIQIKNRYTGFFTKTNIPYSCTKSEKSENLIRISLPVFIDLLDNAAPEFIEVINLIFLNNISFSEFGCCSKYAECEKQGMCLHHDQLYATACQWQKHLRRSGKFGNT